jgi:hypothetical protein
MTKKASLRSKKIKRVSRREFFQKILHDNPKAELWFRLGAFVVLFTLALWLTPPPLAKLFTIEPRTVDLKNFPLNYTVDGVQAQWGYSDWTRGGKPGPPLPGHNIMGGNLNINGTVYSQGIGVQTPSKISFKLRGKISRFSCRAGLDVNGIKCKGVLLSVLADGREIFKSQKIDPGQDPLSIDVPVTGVKTLILAADPATSNSGWTQVDWVDLKFMP